MQITTRTVLELPAVAAGEPTVLAGEDGLDAPVRWVHVTEQLEIAELLTGGELVLTTGLMIGADPEAAARQLEELSRAGAAALVVELPPGREPTRAALERAASQARLPVIALGRRVRFVDLTEAVHRLIVADHLEALEASRRIHETFTQLALDDADAERLVQTASTMLGTPVLLVDPARRVMAAAAASGGRDAALASRALDGTDVPVVVRGRTWGTLRAPGTPGPTTGHVLERAAQALALHLMGERDERDLLAQARTALLTELTRDRALAADVAESRAAALGLDAGAALLPLVVHRGATLPTAAEAAEADRALLEALTTLADDAAPGSLMGHLGAGTVGGLLAARDAAAAERALGRIASALGAGTAAPVIGAGPVARGVLDAAAGLGEAGHVAEAAHRLALPGGGRGWFSAADVRLPGLLAMLAEDARCQGFVRSELAPVLAPGHEEDLSLLRLVVAHGGQKTAIARAAFLSRPAVYHRVGRLEELLGVPLDDPASLASLHAALLLHDLGS